VSVFLATIISCNQLLSIFNRLEKNLGLTPQQKFEVVRELRGYFKSCPIIIKKK
jgi:hypothetical protein